MKFSSVLFCLCLSIFLPAVLPRKFNRQRFLDWAVEPAENPVNIIKGFGYPAEEHNVVTEDGYILTLHRIPYAKSYKSNKVPVLLMHGLLSSSGDFVNVYPNVSLGYVLNNAGYDVWLGNARGNSYSKKHVKIDAENNPKGFYNFSWHEIGKYDIPAMIDYIISHTNHKKIHYVGHSQGGTSLYVAMSLRPEYNRKIKLASLLAPAGLMRQPPQIVVQILARYANQIQVFLEKMQIYHLPFLDVIRSFLKNICQDETYFFFCYVLFLIPTGYSDEEQLIKESLPMIFRTSPSDISMRQIYHYFQGTRDGNFCEYDYGVEKNLEIYGKPQPPEYNLTKITVPIALYYGRNDELISLRDIHTLIKRLPNVVLQRLIPHKLFNHGDFLWSKDIHYLLHETLLKVMKGY